MATSTTTAQAVRDNQRNLIESLNPTRLSNYSFREYVRDVDFVEWSEQNPDAALRRFVIEDDAGYEAPLYSDMVCEEVETTFTVRVAYPKGSLYGNESTDMKQVILQDQVRIDTSIGLNGIANYASGQHKSMLLSSSIEEGEGVDFLVMTFDVIFKRAVDLGLLDLSASISVTATVTAAASIKKFAVAQSDGVATVTAAATLIQSGGTIDDILTAVDPMQTLIDAMSYATKPDYMWGGNEASGATEIGGSGAGLTNNAVDQEQTSAVLGAGNFCLFNTVLDSMYNTTEAGLAFGAGSFAILHICNITAAATNYLVADFELSPAFRGHRLYSDSSGNVTFNMSSSSGAKAVTVGGHSTGQLQSFLAIRDATALDSHLHTRAGTSSNTSLFNQSIDPTTQKFAVGKSTGVNGGLQEWGITAVWKGAAAEALTKTHNDNLLTWLGV